MEGLQWEGCRGSLRAATFIASGLLPGVCTLLGEAGRAGLPMVLLWWSMLADGSMCFVLISYLVGLPFP